jgi:hypothetical protein
MRRFRSALVLALAAIALHGAPGATAQDSGLPPVVGRWNITVTAGGTTYPSWLEVEPSGFRTLVGRFVGRWGSSRPVSRIDFENGKVSFSLPPQWEEGAKDLYFEGQFQAGALSGWMTDPKGVKATWTAVRAPALPAPESPRWGEPVALFNGNDLTGWTPRDPKNNKWQVRDKTLVNTARGCDLETVSKFRDFKLHVEFRYPAGSNSGVYLRGRYEVQITDTDNRGSAKHGLGAIYGFLAPSSPPAAKPGEWQTLDITLLGRIVSVVHNGKTLICEQEIPGITGGALDGDEAAPGLLYLQGDHGPVEFRSIVLVPTVP